MIQKSDSSNRYYYKIQLHNVTKAMCVCVLFVCLHVCVCVRDVTGTNASAPSRCQNSEKILVQVLIFLEECMNVPYVMGCHFFRPHEDSKLFDLPPLGLFISRPKVFQCNLQPY